jgi:hypothetical protein
MVEGPMTMEEYRSATIMELTERVARLERYVKLLLQQAEYAHIGREDYLKTKDVMLGEQK